MARTLRQFSGYIDPNQAQFGPIYLDLEDVVAVGPMYHGVAGAVRLVLLTGGHRVFVEDTDNFIKAVL